MKRNALPPCLVAFLFLGLLFGCSKDPDANRSGVASDNSAAIASLNRQIEDFNANRGPNMGVRPFEQRVSRIEYDPKLDKVTSFDQDDKAFVVLKREPDGRFKGVVEVPYHQLARARASVTVRLAHDQILAAKRTGDPMTHYRIERYIGRKASKTVLKLS